MVSKGSCGQTGSQIWNICSSHHLDHQDFGRRDCSSGVVLLGVLGLVLEDPAERCIADAF